MNIDGMQNVLQTQNTQPEEKITQEQKEHIIQDIVTPQTPQQSLPQQTLHQKKKIPTTLIFIGIGVVFTLGSVAFAYASYTSFMKQSESPTASPTPIVSATPAPSPTSKLSSTPSPTPSTTPKPTLKPSPSPSPSPSPTATPNSSIDLSIESITFEDPQTGATITDISAGQLISARATLKNNGQSDSPVFSSNWIVDGKTVGLNTNGKVKANSQAVYDDVNSLVYDNFFLNPGQNVSITYVVDPDNKINESNRTNNIKTVTVNVSAPKIDLKVLEINFYEQGTWNKVDSLSNGQKYTVRAKIVNTGDVKISRFSQTWYLNNNKVKEDKFMTWAVKDDTQEKTTLSYDFTASPGEMKFKFVLNAVNTIPEIDTSNDSLEKTMNVQ